MDSSKRSDKERLKMNCWEYKECGRQPGGRNSKELGVCPASIDDRLNDVNGGKCSGRACWVIAGTFCDGKIQATFATKYDTCSKCDFYEMVKNEEHETFSLSAELLEEVKKERQKENQ